VTLSDFRAGRHPDDDVGGMTPHHPGSPPITQIIFPACRAHYPGGPNRCLSVSSPFARPSPVNGRVGIHNFTFEACSGFTRVTACKVAARPTADLCPEASTRPVARPSRSVATMSHRQLHRWNLPPLMICALGARVESRKGAWPGPTGSRLFPFPAHQTGRVHFGHPAFRLASPQHPREHSTLRSAGRRHRG
jgi:hypothetical protein